MRRLTGTLLGAALLAVTPAGANASNIPQPPPAGGVQVSYTPISPTLIAYAGSWMGGGPSRPHGAPPCGRWEPASNVDPQDFAWDTEHAVGIYHYRLYGRDCGNPVTHRQYTWILINGTPDVATAVLQILLDEHQVPLPQPTLEPPAHSAYVKFPTRYWVDPAPYLEHPQAGVAFPNLSLSIEAIPGDLTFTSGIDSAQQPTTTDTCTGPGEPWTAEILEPTGNTDCAFTYEHSSDIASGKRFTATIAIQWTITWTRNGVPQGPLTTVTTSTRTPITVKEVQAIVTA